MRGGAGTLKEAVAFDAPLISPDGYGGQNAGFGLPANAYECRAEFIYSRGSEAVDAARLAGRAIYKVKIRQSIEARTIKTSWRMRDTHRGVDYNIREIDTITDRRWIYLIAETGVAVGA